MGTEVKQLMDVITNHTASFLKEELDIAVERFEYVLVDVSRLKLRHLTSLMSVGGNINMYMAFSFDETLIDTMFETYTEDIEVEDDEREEYIEETAGDCINIIIGNATADLENEGTVIQLSPPVIITEAKSIVRQKNVDFYTARMGTPHGDLNIFFVGPKKLFDENLDYV